MIFGLAVTLLHCHSITNFPLVQASKKMETTALKVTFLSEVKYP